MDLKQRLKLKETYSLLPDEELISMAQEGSNSFAEGVYALLLDEIKKRGIEENPGTGKDTPAAEVKAAPMNDETGVDTFVEIAIITNQGDKEILEKAIKPTDISHYFQSLNIRGKDWPVSLMVEQSRAEDAVELLQGFQPNGGMVLW